MVNTKDIKRRIKSVASTQQITKAMKMVSASKLRKAQASVLYARPYADKTKELLEGLVTSADSNSHAFLVPREVIKKVCYVVIGSDKGLCGGFNGGMMRLVDECLSKETRDYALIVLGRRAVDYCSHRNRAIYESFIGISDNPTFVQSKELSDLIGALYLDGTFDEVHVIYAEFRSALTQIPTCIQVLPVPAGDAEAENTLQQDYIFEPSQQDVLGRLLPQYLDVMIYKTLLETKASEHGARMTAMSAATDNADELINKLTLSLNRARQAAITTEISEIVGGASALG